MAILSGKCWSHDLSSPSKRIILAFSAPLSLSLSLSLTVCGRFMGCPTSRDASPITEGGTLLRVLIGLKLERTRMKMGAATLLRHPLSNLHSDFERKWGACLG